MVGFVFRATLSLLYYLLYFKLVLVQNTCRFFRLNDISILNHLLMSPNQWYQFRVKQRIVGEHTHERRATYLSTAFRLPWLIEKYRRTIFFLIPTRRTTVDNPRDFESSIAWCKWTVVISLQRDPTHLHVFARQRFSACKKRKPNECSNQYKCTFCTLFSFFVLLYLLKCLNI